MNDHNLDDLIIDTQAQVRNSKAKGFLTILALLIVVLIAAIVLTKIVLNDAPAKKPSVSEESAIYDDPELTLKDEPTPTPTNQTEATKPNERLTSSTVEHETQPVPSQNSNEVPAPQEQPSTTTDMPLAPEIPEESPPTEVEAPKASVQEPETPPKEIVTIPKEIVPQASKPTPVPTEVEAAKRVTKTQPAAAPTHTPSATQKSYYIQVGSFAKQPEADSLLLRMLKRNHYPYTIAKIGGRYKLLVGPYASRKEANRAIRRVKDRINKQAFIIAR